MLRGCLGSPQRFVGGWVTHNLRSYTCSHRDTCTPGGQPHGTWQTALLVSSLHWPGCEVILEPVKTAFKVIQLSYSTVAPPPTPEGALSGSAGRKVLSPVPLISSPQ